MSTSVSGAGKVEFIDSSELLTTPIAALEAFRAFSEAHLERGAPWVRVLGEPRWAERSDAEVRLWTRFESHDQSSSLPRLR